MDKGMMRKLIVTAASVVLALSMCVPASAAETDPGFAAPTYGEYGDNASIPVEGRIIPDKKEESAPPVEPPTEPPADEETLPQPPGSTPDDGNKNTPGGDNTPSRGGGGTGGGGAGGTNTPEAPVTSEAAIEEETPAEDDGVALTADGAPSDEETPTDETPDRAPAAADDPDEAIYAQFSTADRAKLEAQTGNPFIDIANGNVPLGNLSVFGVWSFLSLLLSLVAIVNTVWLFLIARGRRRKNEDESVRDGEGRGKKLKTLRILATLAGVLTPVIWLLLDDLSLHMVWINKWTLVVGAFFLAHLALTILSERKRRQSEEEDEAGYREDLAS